MKRCPPVKKGWNGGSPPAPRDLGKVMVPVSAPLVVGDELIVDLKGAEIVVSHGFTIVGRCAAPDAVRSALEGGYGIALGLVVEMDRGTVTLALS